MLGVGMCLGMVFGKMLIGIVVLIMLILLAKGIK